MSLNINSDETGQILSRVKPAVGGWSPTGGGEKPRKNKAALPQLEEYLQKRDYLGALTLLEVPQQTTVIDRGGYI